MFHYMAVDDAVLGRGNGKEVQLALDPLAQLSMHESQHRRIYSFLGVCLLRCLTTVVTPFFADARFIRLRGRTPGVKRPLNRFLPASVTLVWLPFYTLCGQDIVGDAPAGLRRSPSQRHGCSLDEWHGAAQQTSEQTA